MGVVLLRRSSVWLYKQNRAGGIKDLQCPSKGGGHVTAEKVHILSRDTIQHSMPRIVTARVFDRWTGRRSTADVQRVGLIQTWQNEISTRDNVAARAQSGEA